MRKAKQKLKNRTGASIMFALLFLLVATMVSVVILDASVTTAKRLFDDTQWQQDNLTLTSAGKLLQSALKNTTCAVQTVVDPDGVQPETHSVIADECHGPLAEALAYEINRLCQDPLPSVSGRFTLTVDGSVHTAVTVDYVMLAKQPEPTSEEEDHRKDSYRIIALLTLEGSDQKLYLDAYRSVIDDSSEPGGSMTDLVAWTTVTLSTKAPTA